MCVIESQGALLAASSIFCSTLIMKASFYSESRVNFSRQNDIISLKIKLFITRAVRDSSLPTKFKFYRNYSCRNYTALLQKENKNSAALLSSHYFISFEVYSL